MPDPEIKIANWNVGGAKYFELPSSSKPRTYEPGMKIKCREEYKDGLMTAIEFLKKAHNPDIITLQEIARYSLDGNPHNVVELFDDVSGYQYVPFTLIDTSQFSARPKWDKVRSSGKWAVNPRPYFAQGNGFFIKNTCLHFPLWALPKANTDHNKFPDNIGPDGEHLVRIERVDLHTGLYFGERNTEPRVALVLHLVLPANKKPLDIFIINVHLTTLRQEREGIPDIDEEASIIRQKQLSVILDGIVSRYNMWRSNGYKMGDRKIIIDKKFEMTNPKGRHNPIWVIAGDLNFTRQSAEYTYLKRRNFMDLIPGDSATKSSGLGKNPTLAVDYIFAGPRFHAFDPYLVKPELEKNKVIVNDYFKISDHYPQVANVPLALKSQ
jgi:endonuclease/exonuclease/phosphatase family metal-dependent hydrolase